MRHGSRPLAAVSLALAAPALLGQAAPSGEVSVTVTGLRSAKGTVLACLTARSATFPNCKKDPAARRLAVPAGTSVELDFGSVPQGTYAISLFHDENGNRRLDKALMMPREGYGFSRDAPIRLGPPSFERASFSVSARPVHTAIRVRYLL